MGAGNTLIHNSQEITVIYKLQIGFVFFLSYIVFIKLCLIGRFCISLLNSNAKLRYVQCYNKITVMNRMRISREQYKITFKIQMVDSSILWYYV